MQSKARTVKEYLAELPLDRQKSIEAVRKVILKNLPKGYEETMQYGMVSYIVPFKHCPDTYNNQPLAYAALASQKNYMAVYLMNIYSNDKSAEWFKKEYKNSGKKLDMGKSCIRFKKLDELPLELIGKAVTKTSMKEFIKTYKASRKK